ncbi:MAG: ribosome maturation factor RimP [Actinomycetota bacterium]|nr:ribosome maturation factor RimP [Actinomycetota bacterium]
MEEQDFAEKSTRGLEKAVEDTLLGLGLELVEIQLGSKSKKRFVRLTIDKKDGVSVEDCSMANKVVGKLLEREGFPRGGYVLEVMSPGIFRILETRKDFSKSVGKKVKLKLKEPFEGERTITGMLREASERQLTIEVGERNIQFDYDFIEEAKLNPDLPW